MLILVEDNLLHVDSSTDVLEHYGVKWGKRLRSAVESVKQAPRNVYNNHVDNKNERKSDRRYQSKYKNTK